MIKNNNLFIVFVIIILIFASIYWSYALAKNDNQKTQMIRLIDIFIYGPFLIWLSVFLFQSKKVNYYNMFIITTLLIMGGTTIGYNLSNYLAENKNVNK